MANDEGDVFLQPDEKRDFALLIDGKKVYVDRYYLAYWSPVLEKIFYPDGQSFKQPEGGMEMKDKKVDEFLIFLHAIFPIKKTLKINAANMATLFAYADEYNVRVLRERCVEFMEKQLNKGKAADETLIDYLRLTTIYNEKDLQKQLVPLVAQLAFDKITAAHAELPTAVLSAVYQSKALAMQAHAERDGAPTLPEGAFLCGLCKSTTCSISEGASSCCKKSVIILAPAAAQVEARCSTTCGKCSKLCSLGQLRSSAYRFSSCCINTMYVQPKCEVCKKRPTDAAAAVRPVPKATDFSADLLDREK